MLIDSHAHLEHELLNHSEIINSMKQDGLEKIVSIGTDIENTKFAIKLAEENKNIYATAGIHPEYADDFDIKDLEVIESLASHEKVVAIGEIGLDYHYTTENKEKQKELFIEQIKLAHRNNLPICIHTRDAAEDTYQILKAYKDYIVKPSIMHCFSENEEYMHKFIDLGFYISFAGNITFKKTDKTLLNTLPVDKILVETDSPYLSPEPMRGKVNVPARVALTAQKIADLKQMDYDKLCEQTVKNTYNVYKKMKKD